MSYLDANLVPGETVAYRPHVHWIVFAPAFAIGAVLDLIGVALMLLAFLGAPAEGGAPAPLIVAGAVLVVAGSVWTAAGAIRWKATEITLTNRRVFIKTGILNRRTTEILLSKVESVSIEESWFGAMLRFGRVTIHGTGGTPEVFDRIARPHEFRRRVQIQIDGLQSGRPSPGV